MPTWMNTSKCSTTSAFFWRTQRRASQERNVVMSVISWLVLGLVAGFLASMVMNKRGAAPGGPLKSKPT
jgi:hypothetical protein